MLATVQKASLFNFHTGTHSQQALSSEAGQAVTAANTVLQNQLDAQAQSLKPTFAASKAYQALQQNVVRLQQCMVDTYQCQMPHMDCKAGKSP